MKKLYRVSGVNGNSFQAEFFIADTADTLDGDIALSYVSVDEGVSGVVGLSAGQLAGASQAEIGEFLLDFTPSDLGVMNTDSVN